MKRFSILVGLLALASQALATDPQYGAIRVEAAPNIVHSFVSAKTQGSDASKVSKDEWNAAHTAPVELILSVPAGIVWPAQPAAVTEFCGVTSYRWRANLTNRTTIRLTAQTVSAGAATSALRLQYTTDTTGATGWDYLDGISGPSVSTSAAGVATSATVSIATAAKADVLLRLVGINGDGAGGTCYSAYKVASATTADSATTATTATTASTVTTNANLTGPITSVGNATTVADPELAALAGLTSAADKIAYFTGSGTAALGDLSSGMRDFMTTSSSANLAAVVTDETGSAGGFVRATGPTFGGTVTFGSTTTAGTATTKIQDTISGSSATSNFLNITGTFPATLSAETSAALLSITGDNDNQLQNGIKVAFSGSNTSLTNLGAAVRGVFSGASNGAAGWFSSSPANGSTNYALIGQTTGSGAQSSVGVVGWSENTFSNYSNHGVVGSGGGGGANPTRAYGVTGMADSDAASGAIGVYGYLATSSLGPSSTLPTPTGIAAGVFDNGAIAANILCGRDNGTDIWCLADGGYVQGTRGEVALNADYTNATTTFSSTALSVDVVSGRTYGFTLSLLLSDSTAADGMKLDFNGGGATATIFRVNCFSTNDTTGATVAFTAATSTTLSGVLNIPTMASTGTHLVQCNGTFVPSSSSTFIVRAAQNAHSTGTLTITRGSWLSMLDKRPL